MVEFRTSSVFRGWVRVGVLCYGFGVRGRKVKSRDLTYCSCALASDLVIVISKNHARRPSMVNDQSTEPFAARAAARA